MATTTDRPVTISREMRDAVHSDLTLVIEGVGGGLHHRITPDKNDQAEARDDVEILRGALSLLDQIGWSEDGDRDSYEIQLDDGIVRVARAIGGRGVATLEDDEQDLREALAGNSEHTAEGCRGAITQDRFMIEFGELVAEAVGMMATTVTIHDEQTRRVAQMALWMYASDVMGEVHHHDHLYDYAWSFVHNAFASLDDDADPAAVVAEDFAEIDAIRAAGERLASVEAGEAIALPMDKDALIKRLRQCERWIRECENFWKLSSGGRQDAMACRDAAVSLLEEFGESVEVVA